MNTASSNYLYPDNRWLKNIVAILTTRRAQTYPLKKI